MKRPTELDRRAPAHPIATTDSGSRRFRWLALCLCVGLTIVSYYPVLGYGLTDIDTLLNIREARVESPSDLVDQVSKPLTGGRAGLRANFYRPTTMLFNSALRAMFGWEPLGYHAVSLGLHALNGFLLAIFGVRCARRARLPQPFRFGLCCSLFLLLHPVGAENVPAVARASDLLVIAFALGSLISLDAALPVRPAAVSPRRLLGFFAFVTLTLTTKEPGIALLAAIPCFLVLVRRDGDLSQRLRRAAAITLPCAGIAALYLVARALVLREAIGGYGDTSELSLSWLLGNALMYPELLVVDLTVPGYSARIREWVHSFVHFSLFDQTWLVALAALGALGGWRLRRHRRAGSARPFAASLRSDWVQFRGFLDGAEARILGFALCWVAIYLALFAATGSYGHRLLYPVVAVASFAPAVALLRIFDAIARWRTGEGRGLATVVIWIGFAAAAAVFLSQTPLLHRYDDWRNSGDITSMATVGLARQWETLPTGARIYLVNFGGRFTIDPMQRRPFTELSTIYSPAYYSLEAWLEDRHPEKRFELIQLGAPKWAEPFADFRHQAEIEAGWLLFNVPRAVRHPFDLRPLAETVAAQRIGPGGWNGDERAFRAAVVGPRRLALTHADSAPAASFVLVFDGERPFVAPLAALSGGAERAGSRPATVEPL